jgi:hypothetical protein
MYKQMAWIGELSNDVSQNLEKYNGMDKKNLEIFCALNILPNIYQKIQKEQNHSKVQTKVGR